jgi:hypothetical protein
MSVKDGNVAAAISLPGGALGAISLAAEISNAARMTDEVAPNGQSVKSYFTLCPCMAIPPPAQGRRLVQLL